MKKFFSHTHITDSNLFFLVEKESDISKLEFLDLDTKILKNITKNLKKDESTLAEYFLGGDHFERLFVYTISPKNTKDINYLLGEVFPKLPKEMTILSNEEKNLKILMKNAILSRYKFQEFKNKKELDEYNFLIEKDEEALFDATKGLIENIIFARDLGNTPSNILYPESFAKIVQETKFQNTTVKIFDFKEIQSQKMGLLEAVGKGSHHKPYMVILEKIVDTNLPTVAFVGKGVTFDTGGIQVKPDKFMYEMKGDMCGAANVLAMMKELDTENLKVNVVAALMLAENHISGESFKPSDIFTSYSGKTVNIIHTDAEGRLVLADGVSYVSKNYSPSRIITVATLTGACMVALGFRYAGIMGDDDALIEAFKNYSKSHFEKYARLPFDEYFVEKTKSNIADIKNMSDGVYAGSTMGGAFLKNFVMNDEPYTHLDIAGTALNDYEPYGYAVKGITGFGVESMSQIIQSL